MRRLSWATTAALALLGTSVAGGCGTPAAQRVHIVASPGAISIEPSSVSAGDVEVVIDGSALFFRGADGTSSKPQPLSEEALHRLARTGDSFHTMSEAIYPGYAGNAYRYTLDPGLYAFLPAAEGERPDADMQARLDACREPVMCDSLPPLPMAVLEVRP